MFCTSGLKTYALVEACPLWFGLWDISACSCSDVPLNKAVRPLEPCLMVLLDLNNFAGSHSDSKRVKF